ncbi:protein tolA [Candidatus Photodesmus katoptron]|uniref:TolA n=1 Tax=Candidatus Photodesmus katoptron Akat1 TaxID=1236703 RepID=S3E025_9GAMM|nr:cell envelope integrity protein TolA [Candidatus Photodesmus katoptron]EPE37566.1 TolA [Candidatus Photodesmus katoptron Akat1]KEY90717.1 protein tolA [Candidatus Photodesmus katoptron]
MDDIFIKLEEEFDNYELSRDQYIADEIHRYSLIYKHLIQKNFIKEDSFNGKYCQINLNLIPANSLGILGDARVISGDDKLCDAAKRAVLKVGIFPLPDAEYDVIEKLKDINLTVVP